jgi:hypothetical protein
MVIDPFDFAGDKIGFVLHNFICWLISSTAEHAENAKISGDFLYSIRLRQRLRRTSLHVSPNLSIRGVLYQILDVFSRKKGEKQQSEVRIQEENS